MIRKFKAMGLTAMTVIVVNLVGASAVHAAQFEASSYPTTVTATSALGNGVVETEGGSVECQEHLEGTLSGASSAIDFKVTFTNCKAFGFASATVHGNGCVLRVHANLEADLICPAGKVLEVTAGTCVMHVASQNGLKWLAMSNGGGGHVDIGIKLSTLTYNVTKDPFLCPFSGPGHRTGMGWIYSNAVTTKPVIGGNDFTLKP